MATGGAGASLGSGYVLLEEIGAGGMGTVWRAGHRDTGEIVAVKLLRDGLTGDEDLVFRFVQERSVMRSLRHPNIVTVRDFVIEGERLALVMDLVEGGDLRILLRQHGTLPPEQAARLMAQVADALAAAHAGGVVHRDVKPGNVLIDGATGQVRLTDFGVARIVHGPGLTQTTSIIGTPTYLSPEVADGRPPGPAVDVYAVGLILYELLAGRPPFVGDHPMVLLRQHATAAPRRLPGMPDSLWSVISACAAKDPAERPPAAQVAAALREAAPSLAGTPALPRVTRADAPSVTAEPLPSAPFSANTEPAAPGTASPAPGTASRAAGAAIPAAETASPASGVAEAPRRRSRRLTVAAAAGTVVVLSGAVALAVTAPWRATDAQAAGKSVVLATRPAGDAVPTSPRAGGGSPAVSPKSSAKPRLTPTVAASESGRKPKSTAPAAEPTRTPSPHRPAPTSPKPEERRTVAPMPEDAAPEDSAPKWRCRAWVSAGTGTGVEMSPCMAVVGDVFYLLGRIRGSGPVRSDVHVQLYNSDAGANVSQPFICPGVSATKDGATCGPFKVTAPRTGEKHNVRERWRRSGTQAFSGGAQSPWTVW
ncbi:serine/threonine-protein kinase [Sphaerisporangium fuscum]|uniref:serine/threonine-protein kinase n=1 Tax=Sphaerisporangium fuscum TaxID=2835868 RepID=UPI001BDC03E8|nr:serine/threonine-protein kinase [Sphaerisporangium fuscum]